MANPISIVPTLTQQIDAATAARTANFTYRGGPLISHVQVFNVFWGAPWQQSSYQFMANNLNTYFQTIVTSPLLDQLQEYSRGSYQIGQGTFLGSATITQPSLPWGILGKTLVRDSAIQNMLMQCLQLGSIPKATPNSLYVVYLPAGVTVSKDLELSCINFCGYHNHINGRIFYAVMPYPSCTSCNTGFLPFDSLTITTSHELCEAITDAIPGQGWYDDTYGEIGDICAWKTKQIGPYTVQREWSQANIACM